MSMNDFLNWIQQTNKMLLLLEKLPVNNCMMKPELKDNFIGILTVYV